MQVTAEVPYRHYTEANEERAVPSVVSSMPPKSWEKKKSHRSRLRTTLCLTVIMWEPGCRPEWCLHSSIKGLSWTKNSNSCIYFNLAILSSLFMTPKCYWFKFWQRGALERAKLSQGKLETPETWKAKQDANTHTKCCRKIENWKNKIQLAFVLQQIFSKSNFSS